MKAFIEELRRRNVFRALAIFSGAAWLVVQFATQVFPFFDIPNWVVRWVVIATLIGLPVTALVSWFYELTPSGFKRESELDSDAAATRARTRGMDGWLLVFAGLIVTLLLIDLSLRHRESGAESKPASIAVMPFKSLSTDAADVYFVDGMQDEILVRLSKIAALRVISRLSTEHYAGAPADLHQIAQELGVTHIVEGSVQRHADSARIAVQLVDAATGTELWAETYDRQLVDIFSVQSSVARAIADVLKAKLTAPEVVAVAAAPTRNAQAYDDYLRGLDFELHSFEPANLGHAAEWLDKAVEADPSFALAWSHLARVESQRAFQGLGDAAQACQSARQAVANAQRLQPDAGETALALGDVSLLCDNDSNAAEQALSLARTRLPNSAEVLSALARIAWRKGDSAAVLQQLGQALELDPRNAQLQGSYAYYFGLDRQFGAARAALVKALELAPGDATLVTLGALIDQADGQLGRAEQSLATLAPRPLQADVFDYQMLQLIYRARYTEAAAALKTVLGGDASALGVAVGDYYSLLATVEQAAGNPTEARQTYAQGYAALQAYDRAGNTDDSSAGVYLRAMLCLMAVGADPAALARDDCSRLRSVAASGREFAMTALDALAQADTLAGDRDAAFDAIARLLAQPYYSSRYTVPLTPALLRQDPLWAPLRNDARYAPLVAQASR